MGHDQGPDAFSDDKGRRLRFVAINNSAVSEDEDGQPVLTNRNPYEDQDIDIAIDMDPWGAWHSDENAIDPALERINHFVGGTDRRRQEDTGVDSEHEMVQ